ncbi:DUF2628 domain-containing protein [Desulfonatronum thioautotrophicum]|uniref:DUF2628 domain-containing protein n=1 Tax=Desulfonatronum thioautotrophicum TaxID=617001 RepID=UPI00069CA2D1|nr:DUF2628 domain-containing protein [Desulfonatronum thioautotrophicum]
MIHLPIPSIYRNPRKYNIFEHPEQGRQAVKQGFSWPAFFLGIIWMSVKGLWKFFGIWLALILVMMFVENAVKSMEIDAWLKPFVNFAILTVYMGIMLYPALKGNEWRGRKLLEKGFVWKGTVEATSPASALAVRQET